MISELAPSASSVEAYLSGVRAGMSSFIMKWTLVVNAIWWVTDSAVMGGIPGAVDAFFAMRIRITVCAVLALVVLWRQTRLDGARLLICQAIWLALFGALGAGVAAIDDLSTPWFHCLYPLLLASSVLPLGLARRVVLSVLMGAALVLGFVLARPDSVDSMYFSMTLGYMVFAVGAGVAYGHRNELQTRENYAQRVALEESAAMIRRQREDLRSEVEKRTRELRLLAGHLDRGSEAERLRIAQELHDELGQSVSALRLSLATTLRRFSRDPASIGANLADLNDLASRVADGTRDAVTRLRPRILDDRGLIHAAEWLVESTARHTGIEVSLSVEGNTSALEPGAAEVRAASAASTAAFRVVQEALTNAVKHSGAQHIAVRLWVDPDGLHIEVNDDGHGFGPEWTGGMGLVTMRERARALGGELVVDSKIDVGVTVTCHLPLPPDGPETQPWQAAPDHAGGTP